MKCKMENFTKEFSLKKSNEIFWKNFKDILFYYLKLYFILVSKRSHKLAIIKILILKRFTNKLFSKELYKKKKD